MSNPPKRAVSAELGTALFVRAISADDEEEANADKCSRGLGRGLRMTTMDLTPSMTMPKITPWDKAGVGGGGGGGRKSKKNNSNTVFSSKHIRQVEARTSAKKVSQWQ